MKVRPEMRSVHTPGSHETSGDSSFFTKLNMSLSYWVVLLQAQTIRRVPPTLSRYVGVTGARSRTHLDDWSVRLPLGHIYSNVLFENDSQIEHRLRGAYSQDCV